MSSKPGRTPPPASHTEPRVAREQAALAAHAATLKRAITGYRKAVMAYQEAIPGTIGHRAAGERAASARAALDAVLDVYVKRNRLDAHARSYGSAESTAESMLKHAKLSAEHHAIAAPIVESIVRSNRAMRVMMERQIAAIDEAVQGDGIAHSRPSANPHQS